LKTWFKLLQSNKSKLKEKLLKEREVALDSNLKKTTKVQEQSTEIQKSAMEIAWKNQELNEQLTQLVLENERTKNLMIERENRVKETQYELDERQKEIRKEEILITAKKTEIRNKEQLVTEKQKTLDSEIKMVEKREIIAEEAISESELAKEMYKTLFDELEAEKEKIYSLEENAKKKNFEADDKTAKANQIFEKAKVIDEEIKIKEAEFDDYRKTIEQSLNEKIEEYDRRIEDLNSFKGIVDDVIFDESQEGQEAKIVVKEAIRQAKKALTDIKARFDNLDENYSSATFKGFCTPIIEIDKCFEELKANYVQIHNHIESEKNLPSSVLMWLIRIEECLENADKYLKSWEFSEAFRNIIWGLSTCKNYELLLSILNDFTTSDEEQDTHEQDDDIEDWYDLLGVNSDADDQIIKKAYREFAKKHHPDKNNGDKESEEKFKKATEAYENLIDPEKRKAYDKKRNNHKK
jgi:DNA repair exonuclease SbcCD ATPase subunit